MRALLISTAAAAFCIAGAAAAAPSVKIQDAVARVVVIPEARNDVKVEFLTNNASLPLRIRQQGDQTIIDGDLRMNRISGCNSRMGKVTVRVSGIGDVNWDNIPRIVIRTPLDAKVAGGGAVFGSVGRSDSLEFSNAGCGDWTVGNVKGKLQINEAGSGGVSAGSAGAVDINLAGSGDVSLRSVAGDTDINVAGSGDVKLASVSGKLNVKVMGSGDVVVDGGRARDINVSVAGSGNVNFKGVADNLRAWVAGSGDIHVSRVTGDVKKSVAGSGDVTWNQ